MDKTVVGIGVTAAIGLLGSYVAYRCGCQHGVNVTEKVVREVVPDTHKLISDMINQYRK